MDSQIKNLNSSFSEDVFQLPDCSISSQEVQKNRHEGIDKPLRSTVTGSYRLMPYKTQRRIRKLKISKIKEFLPISVKRKSPDKMRNDACRNLNLFDAPITLQKYQSTTKSHWLNIRNTFAQLKQSDSRPTQFNFKDMPKSATVDWHDDDANSGNENDNQNIEWSISPSEASDEVDSQMINTPSSPSQSVQPPTELDLLLELIQNEKEADEHKLSTEKLEVKRHYKRCRKGGYVMQLRDVLHTAKTDCKFLQHDKRFGRKGTVMTVLEVNDSFGVHLAKVTANYNNAETPAEKIGLILTVDMASHVKIGSRIEAFFDEAMLPFQSRCGAEKLEFIYVQPYKLLVL